jgi:hypothetical protein
LKGLPGSEPWVRNIPGPKALEDDTTAVTTTYGATRQLSNDMFAVTGQLLSRLSHHVGWDPGTDTFLRH